MPETVPTLSSKIKGFLDKLQVLEDDIVGLSIRAICLDVTERNLSDALVRGDLLKYFIHREFVFSNARKDLYKQAFINLPIANIPDYIDFLEMSLKLASVGMGTVAQQTALAYFSAAGDEELKRQMHNDIYRRLSGHKEGEGFNYKKNYSGGRITYEEPRKDKVVKLMMFCGVKSGSFFDQITEQQITNLLFGINTRLDTIEYASKIGTECQQKFSNFVINADRSFVPDFNQIISLIQENKFTFKIVEFFFLELSSPDHDLTITEVLLSENITKHEIPDLLICVFHLKNVMAMNFRECAKEAVMQKRLHNRGLPTDNAGIFSHYFRKIFSKYATEIVNKAIVSVDGMTSLLRLTQIDAELLDSLSSKSAEVVQWYFENAENFYGLFSEMSNEEKLALKQDLNNYLSDPAATPSCFTVVGKESHGGRTKVSLFGAEASGAALPKPSITATSHGVSATRNPEVVDYRSNVEAAFAGFPRHGAPAGSLGNH